MQSRWIGVIAVTAAVALTVGAAEAVVPTEGACAHADRNASEATAAQLFFCIRTTPSEVRGAPFEAAPWWLLKQHRGQERCLCA